MGYSKNINQINMEIAELRLFLMNRVADSSKTCYNDDKFNDVSEKLCVGFVGTCEKHYTDKAHIEGRKADNLEGVD